MARAKRAAKARTVSRDEARDFYLEIFDSFAVEVYDKGDSKRGEQVIDNRDKQVVVDAINVRLTGANTADGEAGQTIVRDWVNNDYEVWQCWQTHDNWSREQAEAAFDEAWPTTEVEVEAPAPAPTSAGCLCGCGLNPSRNRLYLPGHDARHAGQVARAILSTGRQDLLDTLPTQALRDKAQAQVDRGNSGPTKPKTLVSAADAQDGVVDGYVTVNRRRIPAQRFQVAGATRMNINDAADGSGDWLDSEGYLGKTQAYWLKRFRTPTAAEARVAKARSRQSKQGMVVKGDGPEALKDLFRL